MRQVFRLFQLFPLQRPALLAPAIISALGYPDLTGPQEIAADGEPMLIEWRGVRDANGSGGLNQDTARTKR
jgi:hypothetical protein